MKLNNSKNSKIKMIYSKKINKYNLIVNNNNSNQQILLKKEKQKKLKIKQTRITQLRTNHIIHKIQKNKNKVKANKNKIKNNIKSNKRFSKIRIFKIIG